MTAMRFSVRGLAAVDLYGARGRPFRRRVVSLEFAFSCITGLVLGGWLLWQGSEFGRAVGVCLVGIGANYLPLCVYAIRFADPVRLEREIAELGDHLAAARYYSIAQIRLFVPGLVAVLALRPGERRP